MKKKTAEHSSSLPKSASPFWTLWVIGTSSLSHFPQIPPEATVKSMHRCQRGKGDLQLILSFPLPKKFRFCLVSWFCSDVVRGKKKKQTQKTKKKQNGKPVREGGMCKTAVRGFHSSCVWDVHPALPLSQYELGMNLGPIQVWSKPQRWGKRWRYQRQTTLGIVSNHFRHLAWGIYFSLREIVLLSNCLLYGDPTLAGREVATAARCPLQTYQWADRLSEKCWGAVWRAVSESRAGKDQQSTRVSALNRQQVGSEPCKELPSYVRAVLAGLADHNSVPPAALPAPAFLMGAIHWDLVSAF